MKPDMHKPGKGKPVRLLHIVGDSAFGGGSRIILANLMLAKENGWDVTCLATHPEMLAVCKENGVKTWPFPGIIRPIRPLHDYLTIRKLSEELKGRFDVVHTHTTKGGVVGRLAARRAGIPVIIHTVHGFVFQDTSPWWFIRFGAAVEKCCATACDKMIFVNNSDREWAGVLGIGKTQQRVTVHNGVDAAKIAPFLLTDKAEVLSELGIPANETVCVFLSRLADEKGIPDLFAAMDVLRKDTSRGRIHLLMVGDGPLNDFCRQKIKELSLEDRVHLLGFRSDCLRFVAAADIFVFPSLREGHSIALLEAMALGKPIVATNIRGNNESIMDGANGLMIPTQNPEALVQAIVSLLDDEKRMKTLGHEARRSFLEKFSLDRMNQNVWHIYKSLCEQKGLMS